MMAVKCTIETRPLDDGRRCEIVVTWPGGQTYSTTVVGTSERARWHAEKAFVPDLLRLHPELREEAEA